MPTSYVRPRAVAEYYANLYGIDVEGLVSRRR